MTRGKGCFCTLVFKIKPNLLVYSFIWTFSNLHPVPTPGLDLGLQRTWQGEETWICEKRITAGLSAEYFDYLVNLILPTFQNLGLLTHGGLANSLIPQWLIRPKVHFLLILNGSCKGCGLMGALLWVLSSLRVQAEREPFLGLSLSCGCEVLLWPRQAMVPRCLVHLLRWDTCHFQLPKQVTWPTSRPMGWKACLPHGVHCESHRNGQRCMLLLQERGASSWKKGHHTSQYTILILQMTKAKSEC